jgi:hypothetical protein
MSLSDDVNIDCLYQQLGRGSLICEVSDPLESKDATNEVNDEICYKCSIGKIYRELKCDKISGKVSILKMFGDEKYFLEDETALFCSLRKRETSYQFCLTCPYIGRQFTAPILKGTMNYFDKLGFSSSKENLEKAQEQLNIGNPESSITNSISAVESTFKSILDKLNVQYPAKEQITNLGKSVKQHLHLGDEIASTHLINLIGSLLGCMGALGGLRNDLSDAHGRGIVKPSVYDSYAELALNLAASICTFIIRRYQEVVTHKKNNND